MTYLEISPTITALRDRPMDFGVDRGWLAHYPSRHSFKFEGNVTLHARCDCAHLSIRPEQGQELWMAFQDSGTNYWRPIEINREFAAHFHHHPNLLQRILRRVLMKLRWVLLDPTLDQPPTRRLRIAQRSRTVSPCNRRAPVVTQI
jgi:hypothetical protein